MARARKTVLGVLGIWCAFTSFISPIWLVMIFLYLSGNIYQYDGMMDEGTAGILGMLFLVLWLAAALLPDILFLKKVSGYHLKYLFIFAALLLLLALLCIAICGWNMTAFLTAPGGNVPGVSG